MDRDTRRIIIGLGVFAIGLAMYGISGYYQRVSVIQEVQSGNICESAVCFQSIILETTGVVGGAVLAFAGIILTLIATTFRKIGRLSSSIDLFCPDSSNFNPCPES